MKLQVGGQTTGDEIWTASRRTRRAHALALCGTDVEIDGDGVEFADDGAHIAAAALWSPPQQWRSSRMAELRMLPAFLRAFGSQYRRGQQLDVMMKRHHPEEPHWYLAVIGSDPTYRGEGYGKALMESGLARADAEFAPVYLESSNPDNVPYYERFGFEVIGELELPGDSEAAGPTMWAMWRQPR